MYDSNVNGEGKGSKRIYINKVDRGWPMLHPRDIKNILHQNGLVQNGLFAWGGIKQNVLVEVVEALLFIDDQITYCFTFVDGKLIITKTVKDKVLIDEAVRIDRTDVKEVKLRKSTFGDTILVIECKDDKRTEYLIQQDVRDMKKMVDMFNSNNS